MALAACGPGDPKPPEEEQSTAAEADSFRIMFGHLDQKELDSIYIKFNEAFTERGYKVDKVLEKIAKKDTNGYEFYAAYAFRLAQNNRPKGALECLNVGSKYVKPKDRSRHYFHKALIWGYLQPLQHRDTVYHYLDLAIRNDSLNPFYLTARSEFYNEDSLYVEAINDVNKCLELRPGDTDYVNARGSYKVGMHDFKGALKDLAVLSSINKKNANAYYNRALCYNELKMYKESLREASTSIKLNPKLGNAYILRANAKFHYLKDKRGAIEDAKKAAELGDKEGIKFMKENEDYLKTHTEI
jgi:tetratricopeptide (TPR) repeat protein